MKADLKVGLYHVLPLKVGLYHVRLRCIGRGRPSGRP